MSESVFNETYVFCEKCKENVRLTVSEADLSARRGGLITLLSVHGDPQHALVAYLDKQLRVRGVEYPSSVHIRADLRAPAPSTPIESTMDVTLSSLIDLFGPRQKDAIDSFSRILNQLMFRQNVILIHDDPVISGTIFSSIRAIFGGQNVELHVKKHSEVASVPENVACVYDLMLTRFVVLKKEFDTRYIKSLIKDLVNEPDGLFRLRNEISKLFYAYQRLRNILSSTTGRFTDTRLAHDISIDYSSLPLLLEMADAEGIDVKDRVTRDALGSALRSI